MGVIRDKTGKFVKGSARPANSGRRKGSVNKATGLARKAISAAVDEYFNSETFLKDMAELDPRDRVAAMERLAVYVMPKLQSTSLDVVAESKVTIEDKLIELSEKEGE